MYTPCDIGECPFDAKRAMDCYNCCCLGADEDEKKFYDDLLMEQQEQM